ncbi:PAS domain-containing protein [Algihabitans albus]|uniref:PAS domain-containing protein n=1 Tax=Algihabitans albus TaxID=2164067 RepID=UPI000E5CB731|nr:PAS domain-containing protein [Algihabitans albus]
MPEHTKAPPGDTSGDTAATAMAAGTIPTTANDSAGIAAESAAPEIDPPEIAPEEIAEEILREGLRYWSSKLQPDHLPARGDLDPTEVPRLLPYIELSEVLDGGEDFRFRLVGSHLVDTDHINPTGLRFSAFFENPAYRAYQLGLYRWVFARRRPLYSRSRVPLPTHSLDVLTERLYLPLAGDGHTVDVILNFQVCRGMADCGLKLEEALDPRYGECFAAALRI